MAGPRIITPARDRHRERATQHSNRKLTADEVMPMLRKKGIDAYADRVARTYDQGVYDPQSQSQFWMMFWDFMFNFITDVLLRAGYLDVNKLSAEIADNVTSEKQTTWMGMPEGSYVPPMKPQAEVSRPRLQNT